MKFLQSSSLLIFNRIKIKDMTNTIYDYVNGQSLISILILHRILIKQVVYCNYVKACDKNGRAGIGKEAIDKFNQDLSYNLYKVWNCMASGSYFSPAVCAVLIPKKQEGRSSLEIPTVGDCIAQGVVKDYLEPILEPLFHVNSFGYRPCCSVYMWVGTMPAQLHTLFMGGGFKYQMVL